MSISKSGYIVTVSKNGYVFCTNTKNILKKIKFNKQNFCLLNLNSDKFYEKYSELGLDENNKNDPFTENDIICSNVLTKLKNTLAIVPIISTKDDIIYITTFTGVVEICCKSLSKNKIWENIVLNFLPIPRKTVDLNEEIQTGSRPFLFTINKNDYVLVLDGLIPCGMCIYNSNNQLIIYKKIHFIMDDLTACQNCISIYTNHNSIDICLANNYTKTNQIQNYIKYGENKPINLGIISLLKNEKNNKKNTENRLDFVKKWKKEENYDIFGFVSKGIKLYNFKPSTSNDNYEDLKEIWVNKNIGCINSKLTITPKYIFFLGIEYSKKIGIIRLIGLDRNNGDIKISKCISNENIKNFLSNTMKSDISILKHKSKKYITWGSIMGLNYINVV
jgi:hypothetical protein